MITRPATRLREAARTDHSFVHSEATAPAKPPVERRSGSGP
ncbi:hypothetical protein ABT234_00175 [Streptomyces sp. NPDC001586]